MARAGSIKIAANCTPVVNNSLFLCVLLEYNVQCRKEKVHSRSGINVLPILLIISFWTNEVAKPSQGIEE
jgi:hypothetical protein